MGDYVLSTKELHRAVEDAIGFPIRNEYLRIFADPTCDRLEFWKPAIPLSAFKNVREIYSESEKYEIMVFKKHGSGAACKETLSILYEKIRMYFAHVRVVIHA